MKSTRGIIFIALIFLMIMHPTHAQNIESKLKSSNLSLSFNGTFIANVPAQQSNANSADGRFWCTYDIGRVTDEVREIKNFQFYHDNHLLFTSDIVPGSDLYISNSGYIAFLDLTHHYKRELTIHFYSKTGSHLFSETFIAASVFGFSSTGNKFGVGNATYLKIISIPDHHIENYNGCDQFDIAEDENFIATALAGEMNVYAYEKLITAFKTDFIYPRRIIISSKNDIVAVIDKKFMNVYSIDNGRLLFQKKLAGNHSYRDLMLSDNKIFAGIQFRHDGISTGILKIYDLQGNVLLEKADASKQFRTFKSQKQLNKSSSYKQIPWPFVPFDSLHTIWNYYEQHMSYGYSDWSYLHQGLDIIVPMNEPTYAVEDGFVKCVLTISGNMHWRIAISNEQTSSLSKGWLYAHLVPSTIQFDVGDTVKQFDYLGDIVRWSEDWGHIHFVEIEDIGTVWRYNDNQWGITYNPLLSLRPNTDLFPPIIDDVFSDSKFGFCVNESDRYIEPDSLFGDIDIIIKVIDYIGDSPWQLPAYETYYWIKNLADGNIILPRTLGHILNHAYGFYDSNDYTPYATVIYKRDDRLLPSFWMDTIRNYYHVLTNSNGDSLIDLSEKQLAFATANYPDGDYRIFVAARDQYGNTTIDSMNVKFKNDLTNIAERKSQPVAKFELLQNYPNPFNPSTLIQYSIPKPGKVRLNIYNFLGKNISSLVDEFQNPGSYTISFDAKNLASGIYFYELKLGNHSEIRKMILLH
jgi:hypothetical protein